MFSIVGVVKEHTLDKHEGIGRPSNIYNSKQESAKKLEQNKYSIEYQKNTYPDQKDLTGSIMFNMCTELPVYL